jgi:hypothetical protein
MRFVHHVLVAALSGEVEWGAPWLERDAYEEFVPAR